MPARTGGWIAALRIIMAAGDAGTTQADLKAATGKGRRTLTNATGYLLLRGDIRRIDGAWPVRYVATSLANPTARPHKEPPKLVKTVRLSAFDPASRPDFSRATITRDTTPMPTARWQMQPDQPALGFAKLPLGATLDGHRV